ncbi:MAG TPA: HD domain-containing protein [Anaerolineae bacterium]|nr:HD domain-containing protein [Anaerolineae bacterium]
MPTIEEARQWYADRDPVHGFDHVQRVLKLAQRIGSELGADMEILQAAALLHDVTDAAPGEGGGRANHEITSAAFAGDVLRGEGWSEARIETVQHCIRAHRFRSSEAPQTLEAKVLFDADKLDVVGAFGVSRTLGYAQQAGEPPFAEPSTRFIESGEREPDETHSAYHEYLFKLRNVAGRLYTEPAKRIAAQRFKILQAFFEQLAAEARGEA